MKAYFWLLISILIVCGCKVITSDISIPVTHQAESELGIDLPEGFSINVFADNFGSSKAAFPGPNIGPRFMTYFDDMLIVSLTKQGRVVGILDEDGDGLSDSTVTLIDNLNKPHGLQVYEDKLYIAEEHRVIRGKLKEVLEDIEVVVDDLPVGGNHVTRSIAIKNDAIYLSIGSSCNVCFEKDERRGSVIKCSLQGKCQIFASGLRNSVGIEFNPYTGQLWGTDNGRDLLGNDIPAEEINIIREGFDYGWPICYGNGIHDTEFDKNVYVRNPCEDSQGPVFEMQAHSAPLGLSFYDGSMFPSEYKGDIFIAYHGSWNRKPATGYKIVRVRIDGNRPVDVQDFATGWLNGSKVTGRPVDVIVAKDGALLVSDDNAGKIYRIAYSTGSKDK